MVGERQEHTLVNFHIWVKIFAFSLLNQHAMPNELTRPIIVPLTTVQADWTEVVSDVVRGVIASGSFWVSCYRKGSNTRIIASQFSQSL